MMKFFRRFLIFYLLLCGQQQTVLSKICTQNDNIGQFCFTGMESDPAVVKREVEFIQEALSVLKWLWALPPGSDPSKLNALSLGETSKWLAENIEVCPIGAAFSGLGLSLRVFNESFAGNRAVNRVMKEYDDLLNINSDKFATPNDYLEHVEKRTSEIRAQAIELKTGRMEMAFFKSRLAFLFGGLGFTIANTIAKICYYVASLFAAAGAAYDIYQWHVLSELVNRLDNAGHLIKP